MLSSQSHQLRCRHFPIFQSQQETLYVAARKSPRHRKIAMCWSKGVCGRDRARFLYLGWRKCEAVYMLRVAANVMSDGSSSIEN